MARPSPVTSMIAAAAREPLTGIGMHSTGAGRDWYRDDGWYLSVVEFQPITWFQGSVLNVAASYLWTPPVGELGPGDGFDHGGRVHGGPKGYELRLEYDGDDAAFQAGAACLAARAADEVCRQDDLHDWAKAKQIIFAERDPSPTWGFWNRAMICLITSDPAARSIFDNFAAALDPASRWHWDRPSPDVTRFITDQIEIFTPLLDDFPAAQAHVGHVIETNRALLLTQGYKHLDPAWRFQPPPPGTVPPAPPEPPRRRFPWRRR